MQDKTPAIVSLLVVLVAIYLSNSGKLGQIKAIVDGPANPGSSTPSSNPSASGATSGGFFGAAGSGNLAGLFGGGNSQTTAGGDGGINGEGTAGSSVPGGGQIH